MKGFAPPHASASSPSPHGVRANLHHSRSCSPNMLLDKVFALRPVGAHLFPFQTQPMQQRRCDANICTACGLLRTGLIFLMMVMGMSADVARSPDRPLHVCVGAKQRPPVCCARTHSILNEIRKTNSVTMKLKCQHFCNAR